MAVGLLRHRCAAQPQSPAEIDWSNPITKGLKLAVNPGDGSRNAVNGSALTRSGTIGTTAKGAGKGLSNNGTASNYLQAAVTYGTDITVFALLQNAAGGNTQNYIDEDDNGASNRCFQFRQNSSNQIEFIRFNSSNSPFTATNTNALTSMLDTGFSAGGMSSGTSVWAWQGKFKSSAATLTGSAHTGTNSVRMLASKAGGGAAGLSGSAQLLLLWDRCLSDEEYRSIVDNPWQVFKIRQPLYMVLASTGGSSGTLAANDPADVAAFSGAYATSGALSAVDGQDSASIAGSAVPPAVTGTLSAADAVDIASFAGSSALPGVSGSLSVIDQPDIAAMSGGIAFAGSMAVAEPQDSAAFAGSAFAAGVGGVLSATDQSDSALFAGAYSLPAISGSLVVADQPDAAALSGLASPPAGVTTEIDPDRYLLIPAESRIFVVDPESRVLVVPAESRVLIVEAA